MVARMAQQIDKSSTKPRQQNFVVRGQRYHLPSSSSIPSLPSTTVTLPPTMATSTNMTDSFVFVEDEGAAPDGTTTAATMTTTAVSTAIDVPIRDYLCAVPTLEEAQMWVVALQWAASVRTLHTNNEEGERNHPHRPTSNRHKKNNETTSYNEYTIYNIHVLLIN